MKDPFFAMLGKINDFLSKCLFLYLTESPMVALWSWAPWKVLPFICLIMVNKILLLPKHVKKISKIWYIKIIIESNFKNLLLWNDPHGIKTVCCSYEDIAKHIIVSSFLISDCNLLVYTNIQFVWTYSSLNCYITWSCVCKAVLLEKRNRSRVIIIIVVQWKSPWKGYL